MSHNSAYLLNPESLDVMIAEDAHGMQKIIKSILSGLDVARIRTATDGSAALSEMLSDPPNLLITDWVMAPMNGRSLIRTMRSEQMQPLCAIPAIVLSGHPTRAFVKQAMAVGASQFVTKPVSAKVLCERIAAVLRDPREFVLCDGTYVIEGMSDLIPDWQEHLPFLPNLEQWGRAKKRGRDKAPVAKAESRGDAGDDTEAVWEL